MPLDVTGTNMMFNAVDRGPERLVWNVFGGRVGFTIFSGNGSARLISQSLGLDALCMLKRDLKAVMVGQPGTTRTLIFQKWDNDNKKYNTTGSLITGKDDKNVMYFEIQFQANGNHKSIKFNFRAPKSVTSSTDEASEAVSSDIRAEAMKVWLEDCVPFLMNATLRPYKPSGNNRNSGGGNNSNSNSSDDYSGSDASF